MYRTIITVVGKDSIGICAQVCTFLAEKNIGILDITQTIIKEFFSMMMVVNDTNANQPFGEYSAELHRLGENLGVKILCQKEEIFNKMHRI